MLDVMVSALMLALTLPVMLVAAVAIRLDSAGPVIVRQVRVGKDGVPFAMYWFRSTVGDAEVLTRIGRVLRRTSIDELPQLWNVLRGDMSLVGPRPASPAETRGGSSAASSEQLRAIPGLTGTWTDVDEPRIAGHRQHQNRRDGFRERRDSDHRAG